MTGIERLREVATRVEDGGCVSHDGECRRDGGLTCRSCLADVLYGIACQVEAERVKRPSVLASDGEPLEVGQTVWDTNGDELVIGALEDGGHTVTCRYVDVGDGIPTHGMWSPSDLTHQRPDSWERLEDDAMLSPHSYICACGKYNDAMPKSVQMSIDLVRRARALAERERGQ